jgi:Fic family protein
MDRKLFVSERAGKLELVADGEYYRFEPNMLPIDYVPSKKVQQQTTKTATSLGVLKGRSRDFSAPEIRLFQNVFMIKEATLSSEIEGTRATMEDIFRGEKIREVDKEKRLDAEEINNYIKALEIALKTEGEITEALLRDLHKKLLTGVRGSSKTPGEYKTGQNAIGAREDTFSTAKFVPASPFTTPYLVENLLKFINGTDYEPLSKIAIAHYQFEVIHPFRDGNGRLGRLISMVQICREEFLDHPLLYISEYFNRNRDTYIETLFNVSARGEIDEWVLFFLKALDYQANRSIKLLDKLTIYKKDLHDIIYQISKSQSMHRLVDLLFKNPYVNTQDVMTTLNISQPRAWGLVTRLESLGVLIEDKTQRNRRKLYVAKKIIDIVQETSNE